ncbi:MAG TPA: ATP-binding protein [Kofleriaceae bacterium]|nr:ATP-binding protein [Kofleriaceae bacterium]
MDSMMHSVQVMVQPDDPAPWTHPDEHDDPRTASVTGTRVLVVEDEHLVALDIQLRLARMGFAAEVAFSGSEALRKTGERRFDLILMDIKLRGAIDGIEATRAIHAYADVPVIYLTAYADTPTVERARLTEPYGYLLKPFQDRELKVTIDMALQRHSSDRQRAEQQQLQRFLSEASARLAESLDYRHVATAIAELLVPRYAEWCMLHLFEAADGLPGFTYRHPDRDAPPLDETTLSLVARDVTLGTLTIVGRIGDPAMLEDVAHRLAMALDNALLYRRAERALRMRDDVLAIVSHDLRGPLSTIMMRAEDLARRPGTEKLGQSILAPARRMSRLIGDLLDASAINAGKLTLALGTYDVGDLVREVCEMFQATASERHIDLVEIALDEGLQIQCDRDRIFQVLVNLVSNALRFTAPGGRVSVSYELCGEAVRIAVRDTGIGIPAEQLPHLFEQFWQAPRPAADGNGLGLYISHGILAEHGSELTVESEVGVGTTFAFELPRVIA